MDRRSIWNCRLFTIALLFGLIFCALEKAAAHNLNQRMDYIGFDPETLARMQQRQAAGQALIQAGDVVGLILKATPSVGTPTGAGGYSTFFVPVGSQLVGAQYGRIDPNGNFVPMPMKGQSILALGDGSVGAKAQNALKGLELGPNILGDKAYTVDSSTGLMRGTMAGVYSDTGIFYSTDPKTAWQSWVTMGGLDGNTGTSDNQLTNNSGDVVIPTTRWDAEQLLAFGVKSPIAPLVDSADGRGNTPWGTGSGVAGPQSGYAWAFNKTYWDANASDPARMKNAIRNVGPWQRIKYPGSMVAKDTPGLRSTALGYVGVNGGQLGWDLSEANPLPPTTSWTDATSPKAVRVAWGNLELFRPEYFRAKIKIVVGPGLPNSPFDSQGFLQSYGDTFGGDAGDEYTNKDHLWRYYEPTAVSLVSKPMVFKQSSKQIVAPNEVFTYTIWYSTFGNTSLTNVVIEDTLPSGLTYISATPSPTSTSPLRWNVGTVPANVVRSIKLTVRATGTGVQTNTVCATSTQAPRTCNTDSIQVAAVSLLYPDKTVTPSAASPGDLVTYTLTLSNEGPCPNGAPLVIRELLPTGFTYDSLVSAKLGGAPTSSVSVNASNTAEPVFTVNTGIDGNKALVIVFKARISPTQSAGVYTNSFTFEYESKVMSTGALAPVTVGSGRIGDTIFRDWNGNGVMDASDEGLPSATVQLYASNGTTLLNSTTTDAQGLYAFAGVGAGNYVVRVVPPPGYTPTFDADGIGTANQAAIVLSANESKLTVDFGYRPGGTGSIGDQVFKELDGNATFGGTDTGLANVSVNLYEDTNASGGLDTQDALVATTTTNVSGVYSFSGLATGLNYIVDALETDIDLITAFSSNPFNATTPALRVVTNLAGTVTTADFGYQAAVLASWSGRVFEDINRNGVFNSGTDGGLANITVTLYNDTNANGTYEAGTDTLSQSTTSEPDGSGTYTFTGLAAGSYVAVVNQADTDIPTRLVASVAVRTSTLVASQTFTGADFPFATVLVKAVNLTAAIPGNTLTYTLTPNYSGSQMLTNARVVDTIPTGTTYAASSANAGGTFGSNQVTWTLGTNTAGIPSVTSSRNNSVTTSRTLVSPGTQFTVTQTLTAPSNVTLVVPSAPVVNGTNGVGATLISGPSPVNATVGVSGTTFTWTYQATAGTSIGRLTFAISASSGATTWTSATSNSVLVTPNLTFNTTVNAVPGVNVVSNTANIIDDSGTIPTRVSNQVDTAISTIGSIGDFVWNDGNGNGAQDVGEAGLSGVRVYIDQDGDAVFDVGEPSAVSDSLGAYRIYGLGAGTYSVRMDYVSAPPRYVPTTSILVNVTLTAGQQFNAADFGLCPPGGFGVPGSIGDRVWTDVDADGVVDASESGLAGVPIALYRDTNGNGTFQAANDILFSSTTSNATGTYSFPNLPAGTYFLDADETVLQPDLRLVSGGANLSTGRHTIVLAVSANVLTADFGYQSIIPPTPTATIGDQVFKDVDGDGSFSSGDVGVANVTVKLYVDTNSNGVIDAAIDTLFGTQTTNASGFYFFASVPQNKAYIVDADEADADLIAAMGGTFSTTTPVLRAIPNLTGNNLTADFGYLASPASFGGLVFRDTNRDGTYTTGTDAPLSKITVRLYRDVNGNQQYNAGTDTLISSTSSAPDGTYNFAALAADSYVAVVDAADTDLPSDLVASVSERASTLAVGQVFSTAHFPFVSILTKAVNLTSAIPTNTLTYTLTPNYSGSQMLTNARVIDAIPAGTTYVSSSANAGGIFAAGTVTWTLGSTSAGVPSTTSGRNNTVTTSRSLVGPATQFIVTQTLTAPSNVTGVTPGTPVVNGANGVGATLISGPSPASATVGASGTTFTWTYQATAGTSIGQLTFGITASSGATTWASATSNSVIVTPNLTFNATVNAVPGVSVISNTASIIDNSGAIPSRTSNQVDTVIATTGSIGDTVFADTNANGVQDSGELGVSGVRISIGSRTATTDSSGNYRIYGLDANGGAPWTVSLDLTTLPADWVMTTTPTLSRTLATNSTRIDDADFGVLKPADPSVAATIQGLVWTDRDENGSIDDEESPLGGVSVNLYRDINSNGSIDAGDLLLLQSTTDTFGLYSFRLLNAGAYLVDVVEATLPVGMNYVSGGSAVRPVTVVALQVSTGNNFGYNHSASIGDLVYYDTNNNGVRDSGETGIPDVRVSAYLDENANGEVDASESEVGIAFTNASGLYSITKLPAGNYVVRVDEQHVPAPVGSPNAGLYNTMLPTTGEEIAVTLAAAQTLTTADFGFAELGAFKGHVFYDKDSNTIFDTTETGIANITVTLNGVTLSSTPVSMSTATNAAGEYTFLVPAGTYNIGFNAADPDFPAGMSLTTTTSGFTVTLQGGWELEDLNFGRTYSGALGGVIFADANGNGIGEVGEGGIVGAVVELFDSAGTIWRGSRVTAADGLYRFDGLINGTHVIKVRADSLTSLNGAVITADPVAPLDGTASGTITAGSQNLNLNFGYNSGSVPPTTNCALALGQTLGAQYLVTRVGKDVLGGQSFNQAQCIMNMSPNGRWVTGVRFGTSTRAFVLNALTFAYADITKVTASRPYALGNDVNDDGNVVGHEKWTSGANTNIIAWYNNRSTGTTQRLLTPFDANPSITAMPCAITSDSLYAFGTVDPDGPAGATTTQGGYWTLSSLTWSAIPGVREVLDASADGSVLLVVNTSGQGQILRGSVQDGWTNVVTTFTGKLKVGKVSPNGRYVGSAEIISSVPTPFVYDTLTTTRTNLPRGASDTLGGIVGAISDNARVLGTIYASSGGSSRAVLWESPASFYTAISNILRIDGQVAADINYIGWNIYNGGDGMSADGRNFGVYGNNPFSFEDSLLFQTQPSSGAGRICLGNAVWNDANSDGLKDVTETGVAGAVVRLYATGADGEIGGTGLNADYEAQPSITTTASGSYLFSSLSDGKYYITVTPTVGLPLSSGAADLEDNGQNDDNNGRQPGGPGTLIYSPVITLQAGTEPINDGDTDSNTDLTQDFGLTSGLAVGDVVWNDTDNDGIYESANGELGVAGVTVELLNASTGAVILSTLTDSNGSYMFGLGNAPGNYRVRLPNLPASAPLASSTVGATDNGVDHDNNGSQPGVLGTASTSMSFALLAGTEPGSSGGTSYEKTIDFGLRGCPTLSITPASLASGVLGTAYSQTLTASGGVAPYVWSLASGTLPDGTTLSSAGVLSGTPTEIGTYVFTVQTVDAKGCGGMQNYSVTIACPAMTLNPTSLPNGSVGSVYAPQTLTVSGGNAPYVYSVSSGTLPAGLVLGTDGVITGTPTSSAAATFTVSALDIKGCVVTRSYTLTPVCPAVSVSPAVAVTGTVGVVYSQIFTASGGTAPHSFSVTSGTLPTGLSLNAATGILSGTPTVSNGAGTSFVVRATDTFGCSGTITVSLKICPVINVNPTTLANGALGAAYSQTVSALGGTGPYVYTVSSGTLPAGLSLNAASGLINGTPTALNAGVTFSVAATDANGCSGTRNYTVAVNCPAITITPASLTGGVVGSAYSQTLVGSGVVGPYSSWTVISGTLPSGLTLNASTGVISGTPTASASPATTITVRANDANGCQGSQAVTLQICPVITLASTTLTAPTVGTAYSQTITASGGTAPYTFTLAGGALPTWATLSSTGLLSGTPNSTTSATFTVRATDANGCASALVYTVTPVCPTISITPTSLTRGSVGVAYSQTLAAAGGIAPYSAWTITSGALPAGLTLNASTGVISGTPTAAASPATSITVRVNDTNGCQGTQVVTLQVCPVITLAPTTPATGIVGTAYSQTITASGGAAPYTFAVTSGTLPAGLSLNASTGVVSGTPTTQISSNVTLRATDANGCQGTIAANFAISCPVITVTPATLAQGTVGTAYSQTLTASGG